MITILFFMHSRLYHDLFFGFRYWFLRIAAEDSAAHAPFFMDFLHHSVDLGSGFPSLVCFHNHVFLWFLFQNAGLRKGG